MCQRKLRVLLFILVIAKLVIVVIPKLVILVIPKPNAAEKIFSHHTRFSSALVPQVRVRSLDANLGILTSASAK